MTIEPTGQKTHTLGLISFILAIVGLFTGFLFPFAIQIVGIILGHVASSDIKMNPQKYTGAGLVTAGLIINYLALVFSGIVILFLGAAFFAMFAELAEIFNNSINIDKLENYI